MISTIVKVTTSDLDLLCCQQHEWIHDRQLRIFAALFNLPSTFTGKSFSEYPPGICHNVTIEHERSGRSKNYLIVIGEISQIPSIFGILCNSIRYRTAIIKRPHKITIETTYEFFARNLFTQLYFKAFIYKQAETDLKALKPHILKL